MTDHLGHCDALLGQTLLRYIDRLSDPTPEDPFVKIVDELIAEVNGILSAAP